MKLISKIQWVASILLVFIIVLVTNLIDRDNFDKLNNSIATIYQDRIVANDLLFELSGVISDKHILAVTYDSVKYNATNADDNRTLNSLVNRYDQTRLTEKEKLIFGKLQKELDRIKQLEQAFYSSNPSEKSALIASIENAQGHLTSLSKIQLKEGKRQVSIGQEAMDSIELFTQWEIIFLVVMAVLIQIIILYKPKRA